MSINARTLTATSPVIPNILDQPALIPVSLTGIDGLNTLFNYCLVLKTPDALNHLTSLGANFELDNFIGHALTVFIQLPNNENGSTTDHSEINVGEVTASRREISGIIADAKLLEERDRHVFYEITLSPWLYLATCNCDCRIFQNMMLTEVLDELLSRYPFPVERRLIESYPQRDFQVQYNETDFQFFCRLCEEWGVNWFFEHSDGSHRLVLIDNMSAYKKFTNRSYHEVRFNSDNQYIDEESIHTFHDIRQITTGHYTSGDTDYTRPNANLNSTRSNPRATAHSELEQYQWHVDSNYSQPRAGVDKTDNDPLAEGSFIASLRMESLRSIGHRALATGNLRGMVPGCWFSLNNHPSDSANTDYLILSTHLTIKEVAQATQTPDNGQHYEVKSRCDLHPLSEVFRPARITPRPCVNITTARVVGPEGQDIWTDELGRIKIQFPWDRVGRADQNSSCWIRVSSDWAGNQLGTIHLPRVGQEVLIGFMEGDPDLPVCIGLAYNQINLPPWNLPSQHSLLGFRSRELVDNKGNSSAGRSNHLILDDTDGDIQSQLKSDHQHSQLSMGHITRIEDNNGRKDFRGEGFELHTDGHGVLRAKDGLLVSSQQRNNAHSHITDIEETIQSLIDSQSGHASLTQPLEQIGSSQGNINGRAAIKAIAEQNREIKGTETSPVSAQFKELSQPHLLIASPAGVVSNTPKTTHIDCGDHIALTSGSNTSFSIGSSLFSAIKNHWSIFVHSLGIKLVTAQGPVTIQAHDDQINLMAMREIQITSSQDSIYLNAKKKVVINGDSSFSDWSASGIVHGTSGTWLEQASSRGSPSKLALPTLTKPAVCMECLARANARAMPIVATTDAAVA